VFVAFTTAYQADYGSKGQHTHKENLVSYGLGSKS